jgi:trans-2-enoyl-CoA reductase
VLLRTLATPINPADINQIQGVYPSRPNFNTSLSTNEPSAVGGNEGSFEVESVGTGVKSVKKGDWVVMKHTGFGTWRTHALASEKDIQRVEMEGLSPAQVGTVSVNPTTAYRMLKDFVDLKPGEWFVQNGANSGVGRAAIQMGRIWGLKSLNIIRDRPGIEELKKELINLGATKVVTEDELMARGFADKVKEWTNGGRKDIKLGLNCVGGKPTSALIKLLSDGGHLVTYGGMSKQPVILPTALLIFKDIKFDGFWVSRWSDGNPSEKIRTVDEILQWTREGKFLDVPFVEHEWSWNTKEEALKEAIAGTLEGFRGGKGIFVFKDT